MAFLTTEYEDMELSTQMLILEALKRDVQVEILDLKDNFLRLSKGGKTEYVKQATRTSVDNYIAPLIMENKEVTKQVLSNAGINTPKGLLFDSSRDALGAFESFKNQSIVIKPNRTNFGVGITIIKNLNSLTEFDKAVEEAFRFDQSIIIETFVEGMEYRFLIIDNSVIGVLHRVAANVIGDGKRSIFELVEQKNSDPLRGIGYKKPLEKIRLGAVEKSFLKQQGMEIGTVPKKGEIVYLRKNSNISTGGDSIDLTDEMSPHFKEIAIKSALTVGAKICGADMIINGSITDPEFDGLNDNYSVIELNFNPAIHIHGYPHKGSNRHAEKHILDLLGFK